ncbi:esterase/lipase family protein [Rhodococcus sp. NPDC058521]|uniref:esterase/lipase family protein n=1 Tax=Rhodococcus sp. NPDC058521 TaxID=3346536 RepID=UPI003666FE00
MSLGRRGVVLSLGALVSLLLAAPVSAQPAPGVPSGSSDPAAPVEQAPPSDRPLEGANDWSCKPSPEHPRPVVLVHGTWVGMTETWDELAPELAAEGYCVFALEYGRPANPNDGNALGLLGGADIAESAHQLAGFVDQVREATGSPQVDIVGHSLGGTLSRQYLRFEGGADLLDPTKNKVHRLITLGATNHGTSFGDVQALGGLAQALGVPVTPLFGMTVGPSYVQQMAGSPFLHVLNAGGDTDPGVAYTVVASRNDTVSTPPENTFLTAGPGAMVDNLWIQDGCDSNTTTHDQLTTDPRAKHIVQTALDPTYGERVPAPCPAG